MSRPSTIDFLLAPAQVEFILGPVSISVASADAGLAPSITRAYGCRCDAKTGRVTLFLSVPRSKSVLQDLYAGGAVAAVFSRPSTHQTLQIKGSGSAIAALAPGDRALILAYGESFAAEIRALGYADPFPGRLMAAVREDALTLSFLPIAAFAQTPGPAAGKPLGTRP